MDADALLHPKGPESARTYWIRRAIVLLAALLVFALLVTGLVKAVGALRGDGSTAAVPASESPTAQAPTSGDPTDATATTSHSTASASTEGTTDASNSTPASSAKPTDSQSPSAAVSTTEPSPTPSRQATPTGPHTCDPAKVDVLVRSAYRVKSGRTTTFYVWITNRDDSTCRLNLLKNPLELRIYSGTDRIWSSADCSTWHMNGMLTLEPNRPHVWKRHWSTQRSRAECRLSDEYLRPGTYVATAEIDGGDQSRWVQRLVG